MRALTTALTLGVMLTAAGAVAAQGTNLRVGTWHLNVAKSKYSPGPAPKSQTTYTRVVSKDGKTMTVTVKGTNAQGQPVNNVVVFEKQ
ncbi:MAG TPA: hypothetical protein VFJ02_21875 [Vicinamibacterales bacterium]|nr:hypothetical protein [Vicinamibacterales bacterium]